MEEGKKRKRKVSIFTIFLWLLLIMIMSVILVTVIYKQNAYEYEVDENLTGVQVTFNEETSLNNEEFKKSIYLEIYYEKDGKTYCLGPYYNDELAGQTVIVPSTDFYIHMYTKRYKMSNSSIYSYDAYGFKIDKIEGYTGEIIEIGEEKALPDQCMKYGASYGYVYPESNHYPTNYDDRIHNSQTYAQFLWEYHFLNDTPNTVTLKVKPEFYDGEVQDFTEEYQKIKVYLTNKYSIDNSDIKIEGNYQGKDQDGNYIYQFTNVLSGEYYLFKEWMYVGDYYQVIKNAETDEIMGGKTNYDIESDIVGEYRKNGYGCDVILITNNPEITYIDEYYKLSTAELRVKVESNAQEEKLIEMIKETSYEIYGEEFTYVGEQDGYHIYSAGDIKFMPSICREEINGYGKYDFSIFREEDEYLQATIFSKEKEVKSELMLEPGENIIYLETIYSLEETHIENKARWIDEDQGIAEITFSYTSTNLLRNNMVEESLLYDTGGLYYYIYIGEDFCLSSEYENDPDWLILENYDEWYDIELDEYPPYIYIKEENEILGEVYPIKKMGDSISFHIVYKNKDIQTERISLNTSFMEVEASGETFGDHKYVEDYYVTDSPNLIYSPEKSKTIQVEFQVNGIPKEEKYYVGLFKDETSTQAEEVKEITLENLVGSVSFEVSDDEATYFVYMTDENGNKLEDSDFVYEGNHVDFNEMQIANVASITTDKSVVSSVKSGSLGLDGGEVGIEETTGTGEENYIDNVLSEKEIYIANVSISKTYETERFNLRLEKEWQDNGENRPNEVKVTLYANGIEIEKITLSSKNNWKYVVENLAKTDEEGKEIKYTVTEEKVDGYETRIEEKDQVIKIINVLEEAPDTSDIAIWKYIVVAGIASVIVVVLVIVIVKRKKNK